MDDPMMGKLRYIADHPLRQYPTPAAILDSWIIVNLKLEHRSSDSLLEESAELTRQLRRSLERLKDKDKFLELADKLMKFHRLMWQLEDLVRNLKMPLEKRQQTALEADMKNDERAKLKTEINKLFGIGEGSEAKIRNA